MPGVGVRTGTRILFEVGDGSTFPTVGHLAAYAGLAPATRKNEAASHAREPGASRSVKRRNASCRRPRRRSRFPGPRTATQSSICTRTVPGPLPAGDRCCTRTTFAAGPLPGPQMVHAYSDWPSVRRRHRQPSWGAVRSASRTSSSLFAGLSVRGLDVVRVQHPSPPSGISAPGSWWAQELLTKRVAGNARLGGHESGRFASGSILPRHPPKQSGLACPG
ncbi:transposase [Streptomyces sp. NPDC087901]|uniref:transposase n=1 Tax=Streptomyces sp. NPDC087901 TaxID=3365818 RepID=UPI00382550E3